MPADRSQSTVRDRVAVRLARSKLRSRTCRRRRGHALAPHPGDVVRYTEAESRTFVYSARAGRRVRPGAVRRTMAGWQLTPIDRGTVPWSPGRRALGHGKGGHPSHVPTPTAANSPQPYAK